MAVDFNFFVTVAPEFATANPATVNFFLGQAALFLDSTVWGVKHDYGHALFTAHLMKMSLPSTSAVGGGAITSSKVGDLQRSYAGPSSNSDSAIGSTSYGKLFLQLRKTLAISPLTVFK